MTSENLDDDMVVIRVPRRAAAVFDAHLEAATTPRALKARILYLRIAGVLVALAATYLLLVSFTVAFLTEERHVFGAVFWGAIGLAFFAASYLAQRTASQRKAAYQARGLL